jgi:hypothetical protein
LFWQTIRIPLGEELTPLPPGPETRKDSKGDTFLLTELLHFCPLILEIEESL